MDFECSRNRKNTKQKGGKNQEQPSKKLFFVVAVKLSKFFLVCYKTSALKKALKSTPKTKYALSVIYIDS